ncbi:MAG: PilZ domain-containing protein [Desulfobacterales bacterium]|nr:MAG: PilZ domain-containing protein [Desulfobacterales bacterium]UCD89227.1 MAG: PilZ domain-containing protein [Desulfobacterales bacterium]
MNPHNSSKMTDQSTTPYMAEVSTRSTPNQEVDKNEVTIRLIESILDLPEADQLNLLKDLEDKHSAKNKHESSEGIVSQEEMRRHPRKTSLIAVDCTTHDVCFTNFIQDISRGGVFIETNAHFYVGQQLKMNFSLPEIADTITVKGKVVRIDAQGIGVEFVSEDLNKFQVKI